jgi:phage tail-like protein
MDTFSDANLTAVSVCFKVVMDDNRWPLGAFTTCDGLGLEVVVEQREEGGNNGFVHMLPGRIKYTNIKLSRPVNGETKNVANWLRSMNGRVTRSTGEITVRSTDGHDVFTWELSGVIPVRWTGPSLSAESPKVAMETLELAHHGFLEKS